MILRSDSKYPIYRSYVVKLGRDAKPSALHGRIENIVTGMHRDFTNGGELLDLIAADFESAAGESPGES